MPALLTINNYHYRRGGADVAYLTQAEMFGSKGWRVASFSMQHEQNLPSDWEKFFVQQIEYGADYGPMRIMKNAVKSIYSIEAARKIDALLSEFRPDVAHAHNIYHHLSPSILGQLASRGVPVFLTLHDVKLLCPARMMWSQDAICEACKGENLRNVVLKRCMKGSVALSSLIYVESKLHRLLGLYRDNVTRFVSPSRFVRDKFVEWGWPAERFVYVPNFVEAKNFAPRYTPGTAFLYFGRLSVEKGLPTLVRAAAAAGVPLWLVGTGPEHERLETLARSLKADVTFFGFQTGDRLWKIIGDSRAVVLPSEWYENAPISILEAYALGKPVIGARIGGIPEMVREGVTGFLHESRNVDDLARALRQMAETPDAAVEALGHAAREWVVGEFSPERHFERLVELYGKTA
jgi:glycosyltransferase involved in cell wall biosynthesis